MSRSGDASASLLICRSTVHWYSPLAGWMGSPLSPECWTTNCQRSYCKLKNSVRASAWLGDRRFKDCLKESLKDHDINRESPGPSNLTQQSHHWGPCVRNLTVCRSTEETCCMQIQSNLHLQCSTHTLMSHVWTRVLVWDWFHQTSSNPPPLVFSLKLWSSLTFAG